MGIQSNGIKVSCHKFAVITWPQRDRTARVQGSLMTTATQYQLYFQRKYKIRVRRRKMVQLSGDGGSSGRTYHSNVRATDR